MATTNTFKSLNPMFKQSYADAYSQGGDKSRYKIYTENQSKSGFGQTRAMKKENRLAGRFKVLKAKGYL